jgi:hypothetical protein
MERLVQAIDFVIDIFGALGGGGPETVFWRNADRVVVAIAAMVLCSVLCFIIAVKIMA